MRFLPLLSCCLIMGAGTAISSAEHPNIVLILADDLGWADIAPHSDLHETPNLSKLSKQGVRFTRAYAASPVCTPTRASVLTGVYPARLHMTIWSEAAGDRGNRPLLEPVTIDSLPRSTTTLAEILRDAGYATAHVGKWHLGTADAYPEAHGFDRNIGGTHWGAPQTFFFPFRGDHYYKGWRYVPDLEPSSPDDYLTDRLTDKAIEFIEERSDEPGRPFFLNLSFYSVHTPIEAPEELANKYLRKIERVEPTRHRNAHYAAMVERLDANIGRLLQSLDALELSDQTIVLFASDNGGFIGGSRLQNGQPVTTNAPLRSGKGACYEGGIRVPLIIRAPDLLQGRRCATPVITCDFLPTLLAYAGLGDRVTHRTDGLSLLPILKNADAVLPRRNLFFHYPHYYPTTTPVSAVLQGNWKLLHFYESQSDELFNLDSDPSETMDLSKEHPTLVEELKAVMTAWLKDTEAQLPEPRPIR